jgi:trans-aconitate 2-methyltransferase
LDKYQEWNAAGYHNISTVQEKWGLNVISREKWIGNETVLDAGCGTGRVTRILAEKVMKEGRVYAVDIDSNMVSHAKKNLQDFENVMVIQSDLMDVELPRKVDVIFSNAVIHWILDHKRLFKHFWDLLLPKTDNDKGGKILIQCGGYGNLTRVNKLVKQIKESNEFKGYFVNWKEPWYFAKPDDTEKLLREIGFNNIHAYLSNEIITFSNSKSYSEFVKTIVMKPFLEYLPDDQTKDRYLKLFLNIAEKSGLFWTLDFVRLNILAQK